jgi:hypothetical protein
MDIQDLGAIGEFVSSVIIIVTLMVLIYEVRGSKQATLTANAQERQRKRDDGMRSVAESPDLAEIVQKANAHLGYSSERAAEFGLEPAQMSRLVAYYLLTMSQMRDAYVSGLPEDEVISLDAQIAAVFQGPAFAKWYDAYLLNAPRGGSFEGFWEHVEKIRAML